MQSDFLKGFGHRRVLWTFQPRLHLVDVDLDRFGLSHQYDVVTGTANRVREDCAIGKDLKESRNFALYCLGIAFIELNELRRNSAWLEMVLFQLKKFFGVKRSRS